MPDGSLLRPRTLSYDTALSTTPADKQTIHYLGHRVTLPATRAVPLFDDRLDWWFSHDERTVSTHPGPLPARVVRGVNVPKTGTTIRVLAINRKTHVIAVPSGHIPADGLHRRCPIPASGNGHPP